MTTKRNTITAARLSADNVAYQATKLLLSKYRGCVYLETVGTSIRLTVKEAIALARALQEEVSFIGAHEGPP